MRPRSLDGTPLRIFLTGWNELDKSQLVVVDSNERAIRLQFNAVRRYPSNESSFFFFTPKIPRVQSKNNPPKIDFSRRERSF